MRHARLGRKGESGKIEEDRLLLGRVGLSQESTQVSESWDGAPEVFNVRKQPVTREEVSFEMV